MERRVETENENANSLPAAAWYPDPRGSHELRYWDGTAWTDFVADGGQTSVDGGAAPDTGSEAVLLTLHMAKEVRAGIGDPLVNVHATDRRLLFEYLTSTHIGATIAGGLVGRAIAANAANKRVESTEGQIRTVGEILGSGNDVRTVDYADVKKMLVRRNYGAGSVITISSTRSTVNASKSVIVAFDREQFDRAAELLAGLMPGRVTVKG